MNIDFKTVAAALVILVLMQKFGIWSSIHSAIPGGNG